MRIGIKPTLHGGYGGIYQYCLTMLVQLAKLRPERPTDDFAVLVSESRHPVIDRLAAEGWEVLRFEPRSIMDKVRASLSINPPQRATPANGNPGIHRKRTERLRRGGIDLAMYPVPIAAAFETGIPYVMSIHDLQHRLQPHFPEVSAGGEWERREYLYRNGARKALVLVVDSEVGKQDLLDCYPGVIAADAVEVLPFLPTPYLERPDQQRIDEVLRGYGLARPYLFYPAQFWPHKNHRNLVRAMALIPRPDRPALVMTGGRGDEIREDEYSEVMALIQSLGLEEDVYHLDHVDDDVMAPLYAGAVALVMPTFFGPTNIPVVEAWSLNLPVITSGIRGIREHAGDAARLVDPNSPESIAEGIIEVCADERLRIRLVQSGRLRLEQFDEVAYRRRLGRILDNAADRLERTKGIV